MEVGEMGRGGRERGEKVSKVKLCWRRGGGCWFKQVSLRPCARKGRVMMMMMTMRVTPVAAVCDRLLWGHEALGGRRSTVKRL